MEHLSLAISGLSLVMGEGGHFRHTLLGPKKVAAPGKHTLRLSNKPENITTNNQHDIIALTCMLIYH